MRLCFSPGIVIEHLTLLWEDTRYGLRILARAPGFTTVALISLTLGICIATCAYSEMNGIVLKSVPRVAKPDELVALQTPVSYPYYKRYRQLHDLFFSTFAYVAPVPLDVTVHGRTERTWAHLVTPSYFSVLGVRPMLGRVFDQQEDQPGQQPTVVISYRFWQGNLGGDVDVIGKTLRVNARPTTIIGVGPKDFLDVSPAFFVADLWMPIAAGVRIAPELAGNVLERSDLKMFQFVGRLRPGVSVASAELELDAATRQLESTFGDEGPSDNGPRVLLTTAGRYCHYGSRTSPSLRNFFGAGGLG